jgi:hypothetical protein
MAAPATVKLRGEEYPLDYFLEDGVALVRARVPEKVLWELKETDVPELDRPLHWTVMRGKRDAIRAETLEEARELAARPRVELRREGRLEQSAPRPSGKHPRGSGGGKHGRSGKSDKADKSESRGRRRRDRGRGGRR